MSFSAVARGKTNLAEQQNALGGPRRKFRPQDLVAAASVVAPFLGLFVGGLLLQKYVLAPGDAIVAGPLYGGGLLFAPLVLLLFGSLIVALAFGTDGGDQEVAAPLGRPAARSLLGLLAFSLLLYILILSRAFYADSGGVVVYRAGFLGSVRYPWSDVSSRSLECRRTRNRDLIFFRVRMRDGRVVDLGNDPFTPFETRFARLDDLTSHAARTSLGEVYRCPPYLTDFILKWDRPGNGTK
jgi:hypothetical protein